MLASMHGVACARLSDFLRQCHPAGKVREKTRGQGITFTFRSLESIGPDSIRSASIRSDPVRFMCEYRIPTRLRAGGVVRSRPVFAGMRRACAQDGSVDADAALHLCSGGSTPVGCLAERGFDPWTFGL